MNDFYVVKKKEEYNNYGELIDCFDWEVVFYCPCADSYPKERGEIGNIASINYNGIEIVRYFEIVFIDTCNCKCIDLCNLDIKEGDYAYIKNKYWKVIGKSDYDLCGCHTLKFILERLEPRETSKKLIECISCFKGGC